MYSNMRDIFKPTPEQGDNNPIKELLKEILPFLLILFVIICFIQNLRLSSLEENCTELENKCDDVYHDGYIEGRNDGYDEGYACGYDDAYLDGLNDGYDEGYRDGIDADSYDEGYDAGYDKGYSDGLSTKK